MALTLAQYRTQIRVILSDAGATRFSNDLVDESLREAMRFYNRAIPQLVIANVTVAAASQEQSLTSLTGLQQIIEINWPYVVTNTDPPVFEGWYHYNNAGVHTLHFGPGYVPAIGELIRVTYTKTHTIKDLDSAAATTILPDHEQVLARGAAAHAAILRANMLIESYGNRSEEWKHITDWANSALQQYLELLEALGRNLAFTHKTASSWPLDDWDTRHETDPES